MIRHTLTPLPSGNFLLKMFDEERCLQTTEVTAEDARAMRDTLALPPLFDRKEMLDRLKIPYEQHGDAFFVAGRLLAFITDGVPINFDNYPHCRDVFAYLRGKWEFLEAISNEQYSAQAVGQAVRNKLLEGEPND